MHKLSSSMFVFVLLLATVSSWCTYAQAEDLHYTLDSAVKRGLAANPSVESRRLILEQAQMNVKAARGYFFPSVSAQYGYTLLRNSGDVATADELSQNSSVAGVRVRQVLFDGFSILNNYEKAKISKKLEEARLDQSKLDLVLNIQQNFLQLLKSRKDLDTIRDSYKRIQSQLEAARMFARLGLAPYQNVLQQEVELEQVRQDEIKVNNIIRTQEIELNKLLGYDRNTLVQYEGEIQSINSEMTLEEPEAVKMALDKRPDVIIAKRSIEEAEKQANTTFGKFFPRVTADYSQNVDSTDYSNKRYPETNRTYWSVAGNVVWDLFDGGTTTYTYKGEQERVAALRKACEDTYDTARAEVAKSFLNIQDALKLIDVSKSSIQEARESYDMALARYKTQIGTINDLLDAQYKLTKAEADLNNAFMEYHVARAKLFHATGTENDSLN